MGLLDDAIREHLDLKRRRGADPSEIAREESEALGPVRRGELEVEGAVAVDDVALDDPAASYDDDADELYDDRPVPSEPPQTHAEPYAEPVSETATPPHGDPLLHQATREFSADELDEALGAPEDDELEPADEATAPAAPAHDDDPDADDDEDVLEETPDFLQETPEHDRLWFEQKPPKDFDF
jgi:hypothetical protein